jgi:dienelactone hydrolase
LQFQVVNLHNQSTQNIMPASDSILRTGLDRRQFCLSAGLFSVGFASKPLATLGQNAATLSPLNRFPRMVQEYFVDRTREIASARTQRIYGLRTQEEARDYVKDVQARIRTAFGPLPEKTPLNARVTKVLDRDTYRIENIIFESRPGFLVTANLYVPKETNNRSYPLPGVIGTCGHSTNGKAAEAYQSFAQGLARQGYVVLIYDPIGQGERLQYPDENLKSEIGVGVREHLYAGNQQGLVGDFLGTWRAWDGIRALDYLLTRDEVDKNHLGVTGNSGGGTLTTWLAGLDQRYTMAAPSCFVTSFLRNLENELPADTEQCPPKALALGLDHEDFLVALAPKPVIILTKERDYFDVRGSEAALARLKHVYRLLGAEDNIALFTGPTTHGYSQENREAMYGWFNKITGIAEGSQEPPIKLEPDEALYCAPQGQVATLDSRTVYDFTREKSRALSQSRGGLEGDELKSRVKTTLRIEAPQAAPEYRILRNRSGRRFPLPRFTTYAIETEPGIHTITYRLGTENHYSRPPKNRETATLYVSHLSSDEELRSNHQLRQIAQANPDRFYACDVRGTGESQPDTCGANSFLAPYGSDYFYAIHSMMLDDPYPGQKARDVLGVIRWLKAAQHRSVHLIADGRGCLPATLAALFSSEVEQLTLINSLNSFAEIAESKNYDVPLSGLIPNVLSHFDLPDIYRELERNTKLKLKRITDAPPI